MRHLLVGVVGLNVQPPVLSENPTVGADSPSEQTAEPMVFEELLDKHLRHKWVSGNRMRIYRAGVVH